MIGRRAIPTILAALAVQVPVALANPQGPQVVSGTASFSQPNAHTLNVTNSHNAIINWQSFDIGAGQTTNFIQPSSASSVLNRVLSNDPSKIYGTLNSNGHVFLINQHGLMIGAGAQINTAGFYGSTLNITNEDFLNGNLKFEGGGYGGIVNQGYIHAPSLNHAVTAAVLRNGYLSNATPDNPGSLAVNLSSERVRLALSIIEGMKAEQSLGALLGYQFERGLQRGVAGRTTTGEAGESGRRQFEQPAQAAALGQQRTREVDRIGTAGTAAEQDGEQFGVAQGLRTTGQQPFARTFVLGPVANAHG